METGLKSAAAVIMLLSAAALQSQTRPPETAARLSIGTGGIRGRVLAAATETPLRNARVEIASATGSLRPLLTDGDGRFSFLALPAGRYTLTAANADASPRIHSSSARRGRRR